MKKYLMFIIATLAYAATFAQGEEIFIPESRTSIYELYLEGGVFFMSLITLCLVGVLLAAWKMPSRVKELGIVALVLGFISWGVGVYQAMSVLQNVGDISPSVLLGGAKVALIAPIWGCIVFIISLVVRIIQKPKTI